MKGLRKYAGVGLGEDWARLGCGRPSGDRDAPSRPGYLECKFGARPGRYNALWTDQASRGGILVLVHGFGKWRIEDGGRASGANAEQRARAEKDAGAEG